MSERTENPRLMSAKREAHGCFIAEVCFDVEVRCHVTFTTDECKRFFGFPMMDPSFLQRIKCLNLVLT